MLHSQPWKLIVALGAFALIRPIMSALGMYDSGVLEKPVGPIAATVLIGLVWIVVAVVRRLKNPVLTLGLAGVAYGVLATVLNLVLNAVNFGDAELIPLPGMISMIVVEALFGALCGLLAKVFFRTRAH